MRTINAAIIGCGALGRTHAECIGKIEGFQTTAYCDVFIDKAEQMLKDFGGAYATDDLNKIFRDESIDAVYIATLHDTHAEYCIRALEAGKHVMVEKPLALSVEECLDVIKAVERTGKKLMTAFKMRYFELLLKAKELIPNPVVVTMQMMDNRWADHFWANDPLKGGGNVLSQGVHSCDILRFVSGGEPIDVYAAGANYYQAQKVIDNLTAVFRFNNGVSAGWVQGDCSRPPVTSKFFMQIFAENKSITLNDRLTTLTYTEMDKDPVVFKGTETGFMEENIAFYECMSTDTSPKINHIDGLYATLMVLQAFKSIESGKPEPILSLVKETLEAVR